MPIFEEKIICPLAVRFSQDHIRPEFQKGPDIDSTIKAIKTKPGKGDYDIVLVPPFPAIEIIRGYMKNGDGRAHWISLDNRRLYCLQCAAVAAWPQRVAVMVEALRAPTEGVKRKLNTSVKGLSVGIGHSPHTLTGRWDWNETVEEKHAGAPQSPEHDAAHKLVLLDDAKSSIQDLPNAEVAPSMMDLFFQSEEERADAPSNTSTAMPRSPRVSEGSTGSSPELFSQQSAGRSCDQHGVVAWMPDISGAWRDGSGNTYKVTLATDLSWTCCRKNPNGSRRKFTLWYDEASDSMSWGDDWSFWADAADIRSNASSVKWFPWKDIAKRAPRFQWCRSE